MSIKYKMIKREDYINPEGEKKQGYYPQIVRVRTLDIKEISEAATEGSFISSLEMESAIRMLFRRIEKELLDSNHVCLNGFGTFFLTAESRYIEAPDEVRAKSIRVKRVAFTPSKILMKRIKNAKFVRMK